MQDTDVVPLAVGGQVSNPFNNQNILNWTLGLTAEIAKNTTVTTGLVIPIRDEDDRQFDFEGMLQVNHYFGASAR